MQDVTIGGGRVKGSQDLYTLLRNKLKGKRAHGHGQQSGDCGRRGVQGC